LNGRLIKTTTADDSCDEYMFEDYKAYTIQKTIDKIIEILNTDKETSKNNIFN